jgi:hypothetical protein
VADNTSQSGSATIAADDVTTLNGGASSGVLVQRVKATYGDDGTARDVSTAFPFPTTLVSSGGLSTAGGTISAAAANTPGTAVTASTTAQVVANTALAGNATFHVVTTAFVGTLVFEGSVDGGLNYAPIMALREDGTGAENSLAISTAAAFIRQYTVALPGLAYFRVRCSAFTSGTVAVLIAPGPFLIEPNPSLAASTASIGTVQPQPSTLAVTTTAAISTAATLTLPAAGAGLFHYITSIVIQRYAGAALTGAAAPVVVTTTNLPGSLAWSIDTAAAIGTSFIHRENYAGNPLKSSAANTATTIVAPLYTSAIWRLTATYYTGV